MRVSVCMASYNGEKYIKKQIESIIIQLSSDDEIIISDDGSIDNTINIIEGFKDSRIKVFNNQSLRKNRKSLIERFRSATKNFENALKNASGEFIFLSEQDDIWLDNRGEITLQYLKECDLVVSDYSFIDHKLFLHRSHGQNTSYSFERSKNSLLFKLSYRLDFMIKFFIRYAQLLFKKNR